jgi:hypothetical protein
MWSRTAAPNRRPLPPLARLTGLVLLLLLGTALPGNLGTARPAAPSAPLLPAAHPAARPAPSTGRLVTLASGLLHSGELNVSVVFEASTPSPAHDYAWTELPTPCNATGPNASKDASPDGNLTGDFPAVTCRPLGVGTYRLRVQVTFPNGTIADSGNYSYTVLYPPSVTIVANHAEVDLGESVKLTAELTFNRTQNQSRFLYSWSQLPVPCHTYLNKSDANASPGGDLVGLGPKYPGVVCTSTVVGRADPHLTVTYPNGTFNSSSLPVAANATFSVAIAHVGNLSGPAPFTVQLIASLTGGAYPFTVLWLLGDGTLGIGTDVNHTYTSPGVYEVEVWANDSTVGFAPLNGSRFAALNITVVAGPPKKGLFGLPSPEGLLLVLLGGAVVLLAVVYWYLTRGRSKQLPPPEAWMIPPEEGRPPPGTPRRPPPPWPPPST